MSQVTILTLIMVFNVIFFIIQVILIASQKKEINHLKKQQEIQKSEFFIFLEELKDELKILIKTKK